MNRDQEIDAICREIEKAEVIHDNLLNQHGEVYLWTRRECMGQIHGLRKALCILKGWPLDEALHEGKADQFVRQRADVPRETSLSVEDKFPHEVDVTYQVDRGAWRTAQRTVQARDVREAVDLVRAQLTLTFGEGHVIIGDTDVRAVPDGGPVVDVPRETSTGEQ